MPADGLPGTHCRRHAARVTGPDQQRLPQPTPAALAHVAWEPQGEAGLMARIAIVIPVYQAEQTLDQLSHELVAALLPITDDYEVWLVDDGSTDASWEVVQRLSMNDGRFRGLRFIRNFGEHIAITAGLDHANGDVVVIMACDLQDDPAALPRMIAHADAGADLVLVRRMNRRDAWLKRQMARLFYALISLLFSVNYDYRVGNYRLLTRRAVRYFNAHRERTRNINAIMALMDVSTAYVDVAHRPRSHGRSTYSFGKSSRMAASVIVGYSDVPLLLPAALGLVLLVLSLGWTLAWAMGLQNPSSDLSIVLAAIGGVGGLVLLNFGIVGAYLGRAAREAKERPIYFVGDTTPGHPKPPSP
jgi:glycosyltransferase involved in cell wall biosynthesis